MCVGSFFRNRTRRVVTVKRVQLTFLLEVICSRLYFGVLRLKLSSLCSALHTPIVLNNNKYALPELWLSKSNEGGKLIQHFFFLNSIELFFSSNDGLN